MVKTELSLEFTPDLYSLDGWPLVLMVTFILKVIKGVLHCSFSFSFYIFIFI